MSNACWLVITMCGQTCVTNWAASSSGMDPPAGWGYARCRSVVSMPGSRRLAGGIVPPSSSMSGPVCIVEGA
eukprot:11973224-Prorocentrum_lima.AAC.1